MSEPPTGDLSEGLLADANEEGGSQSANDADVIDDSTTWTLETSGVRRYFRTVGANIVSAGGFCTSAFEDARDSTKQEEWNRAVQSLETFLRKSGIDVEMEQSINVRLYNNLTMLHHVQQQMRPDLVERVISIAAAEQSADKPPYKPNLEEGQRWMKFASAIYGPDMMDAARLFADQECFEEKMSVEDRIRQHTGLQGDILTAHVAYGDDPNYLRHMVVVDHEHKAVVLAVRGTFSLTGIVVDLIGYAEPFCGGQAHAGMAFMARRVWEKAYSSVRDRIADVPKDYELIITGHSLGAGVACLITILVYAEDLLPEGRKDTKVRCFAYAPPPVFSPLSAAPPEAVKNTVAYIHANDVVPSLSVYGLRRLFAEVAVIDQTLEELPWMTKCGLRYGCSSLDSVAPDLANVVQDIQAAELPQVEQAPLMTIPAAHVVWLKPDSPDDYEQYTTIACDSMRLAEAGIWVGDTMIDDHHPPKYEHAFRRCLVADTPTIL